MPAFALSVLDRAWPICSRVASRSCSLDGLSGGVLRTASLVVIGQKCRLSTSRSRQFSPGEPFIVNAGMPKNTYESPSQWSDHSRARRHAIVGLALYFKQKCPFQRTHNFEERHGF